jgi:putative tryptophan/tyrosine transport system substrate-binding protein
MLQQTHTIPIVFAIVADPIGSGFVASFPQPGGNITGFVTMEPTMAGKWLELLKEIAPRVARVAMLFNPATAPYAEYWLNPFKAAAASFAVQAIVAPVHDKSELESVVVAQAREPNGGLIVMPDTFTTGHRSEITSLAARYRLPAVYPYRVFAEFGGLLSYGDDLTDNFRRAASYADRVHKGAKPSELPVQAPVKFELVINLKTAKALGLDVPAQEGVALRVTGTVPLPLSDPSTQRSMNVSSPNKNSSVEGFASKFRPLVMTQEVKLLTAAPWGPHP